MVRDVSAVPHRVEQPSDSPADISAVGSHRLEGHDLRIRGDSSTPDAVVGHRGDRARHMGAVACVVCRVGIPVVEVPTVDVVDQPVVIVVEAVVGNFARVGPNLASQIRVVEIDPRIDHRHHRTSGGDIPRGESIHPRGGSQAPLGVQLRVVGRRREMQHGVQTRRDDDFLAFEDLHSLFRVGQRFNQVQALPVQRLTNHRTTNIDECCFDLINRQRQIKPDHHRERVVLHIRVVL